MSKLNKLDEEFQERGDLYDLEADRCFGWDLDVTDTWYKKLWTRKLSELDCFYHYSYLRSF